MEKTESWRRRLRNRLISLVYQRSHRMTLRQALSWKAWQIASGANAGAWWPVHPSSVIIHAERIKLGAGSRPGYSNGCYIQANNGIEIGDSVMIAPGAKIISANHNLARFKDHVECEPIRIGSRCWLGANSVILPGVQLGDEVVVAAGAVVTKSFPSRVVVAGVPAKVLRQVDAAAAEAQARAEEASAYAGD